MRFPEAWLFVATVLIFSATTYGDPNPRMVQTPVVQTAGAPDPSAAQAEQNQTTSPGFASSEEVTSYTLPPDLYRKARNLGRIVFWGQIFTFFYSAMVLILVLKWRLAPKYRDWAEKLSRRKFVQAACFSVPFFLTLGILGIPLDIAQQWVLKKFGLSIQGWGSWLGDWSKGQMIAIFIGDGGFIFGWSRCRSLSF